MPTNRAALGDLVKETLNGTSSNVYHTYITFDLFCSILEDMGYTLRINMCNDDVQLNGQLLTDLTSGTLKSRLTDFAHDNGLKLPRDDLRNHLLRLASKTLYHPVKKYLEALKWDGGEHIENLCAHFTDTLDLFPRWFQLWIIGAVARIYDSHQNPMLVLDGSQNIGKSFFAQWLCSPLPEMFKESSIQPDYKAHRLARIDNLVWEVQELGSTTRRADQAALKAFLTDRDTKDLKPYGTHAIQKPNIASYIGTVNSDAGFLTDRTGNRRYLVCTLLSIDWLYSTKIDINQVWAQAYYFYSTSDNWRIDDTDKAARDAANQMYLIEEPVETVLADCLEYTGNPYDRVSSSEIQEMLIIRKINPSRAVSRTTKSILVSWGCEHKVIRIKGNPVTKKGYTKVKVTL